MKCLSRVLSVTNICSLHAKCKSHSQDLWDASDAIADFLILTTDDVLTFCDKRRSAGLANNNKTMPSDCNYYIMYCCCGGVNRAKDIVAHCKIEHRPTGYGFAEPYHVHESLRALVRHYRRVTLVEHNPLLDVTLALPVNAPPQAHDTMPSIYQVSILLSIFNNLNF